MNRFLATAATVLVVAASQAAMAASPMTDGEVTKIDKPAAKLTLKHAEIKSLDMPAMTMAYRVKDPAMLDKLQVGDKVRFSVERIDSQYTIVAIEPAR